MTHEPLTSEAIGKVTQVGPYLRIKIEPDEFPESPREWDNLGTMVCWHRRYDLGDEQPQADPGDYKLGMVDDIDPKRGERARDLIEEDLIADAQQIIDDVLSEAYIILPLYLYDHGGLSMNTTGFSCPWDSGQVGFIYAQIEKVKTEYGWTRLTRQRRRLIETGLKYEVEAYDLFLRGAVYRYQIEGRQGTEWELLDACSSIYSVSEVLNEVNNQLRYFTDWKPTPKKIQIILEGGVVQNVYHGMDQPIEIEVLDLDTEGVSDAELITNGVIRCDDIKTIYYKSNWTSTPGLIETTPFLTEAQIREVLGETK